MSRLILASSSPRRLMLLEQIGIKPSAVDPADIDESMHKGEKPRQYVLRVAAEKARVVAARHPGAYILSGDTAVVMGQRVLPKTENRSDFDYCWKLLPGRRHRLLTAAVLLAPDGRKSSRIVEAAVTFRNMTAAEIEGYFASKEWKGKAGGYAYQGIAAKYIRATQGNAATIIGLPVYEVSQMLTSLGYHAT